MRLVIKVGGEILAPERRAEAEALATGIAGLTARGARVVVVHGGGPQATALQERLGLAPKIVGGRRVTDAAALDVIKMVIAGKLNVELCGILAQRGISAVGLHGVSGRVIAAERRPPKVVSGGGPEPVDFGFVGDVTGVNLALLELLLGAGHVPVLASLGAGPDGQAFNINADTVAAGIAQALRADHLVAVTGVSGVLRDKKDPRSLIPRLTIAEGRAAIRDGGVDGGMIPKVEEAILALEAGVGAVHIVGKLEPDSLESAIFDGRPVGTRVVP